MVDVRCALIYFVISLEINKESVIDLFFHVVSEQPENAAASGCTLFHSIALSSLNGFGQENVIFGCIYRENRDVLTFSQSTINS